MFLFNSMNYYNDLLTKLINLDRIKDKLPTYPCPKIHIPAQLHSHKYSSAKWLLVIFQSHLR